MSVTAVPLRPLARGSVARLWIGLLFLALAAVALAWVGTSGQQRVRTASGLEYQIIEEGEGNTITAADLVLVHFVGRRENGEVFANTLDGQPIPAAVGNFIPGFDEALQMMRQGSRFKIWIPPQLGYRGEIPAGAPFGPEETLVFDLRILQVAPGMAAMQQLMGPQGSAPDGAAPGERAGRRGGEAAPGTPTPDAPAGNRQ